jgi:hypothetical protein
LGRTLAGSSKDALQMQFCAFEDDDTVCGEADEGGLRMRVLFPGDGILSAYGFGWPDEVERTQNGGLLTGHPTPTGKLQRSASAR